MLIFDELACAYNGKVIFSNLSASIPEGSSVLLTGANGSGKTSLLKIIGGLQQPYAGNVAWNDYENVRDAVLHNEINVNFVGHDMAIKEELTVLENVVYWAELAGEPRYIKYALEYFGLKKYARTPCSELSKGWQKKVALARLITGGGDLWLLDEPFSNLDVESRLLVEDLITNMTEAGGIAVVSAHSNISVDFNYKINISDFSLNLAEKQNTEQKQDFAWV